MNTLKVLENIVRNCLFEKEKITTKNSYLGLNLSCNRVEYKVSTRFDN